LEGTLDCVDGSLLEDAPIILLGNCDGNLVTRNDSSTDGKWDGSIEVLFGEMVGLFLGVVESVFDGDMVAVVIDDGSPLEEKTGDWLCDSTGDNSMEGVCEGFVGNKILP
jgi:hypothetical protein